MFGGLAICSLEAVVGKDDTEHIIEVNDCAMNLMGETAQEDRNMIAELVIKQMEVHIETVEEEKTINILFCRRFAFLLWMSIKASRDMEMSRMI